MKIAEQIGAFKRDNNIVILQTNRWNDILQKAFRQGEKLGLSQEFITKYLDAIHLESINRQNKIMNI
jgi:chorismate mutase